MRNLLLALALYFVSSFALTAADMPPIHFQQLAPGQQLTVTKVIYAWEVPGMVPDKEVFDFRMIDGKLTVEVSRVEKAKDTPEKKTVLGKTELTAKEAGELDQLMDLYRKRNPHHDLVVENLELTLQDQGGKVVSKESYVDETGLRDKAELTRFSTIVSKLSKP